MKYSNNNVFIPKEELPKVIEIVLNGGTGADIYNAKIKTSKGKPVSKRQARRYREEAEKIIEELDFEIIESLTKGKYLEGETFQEDETKYYPVLAPDVKNHSCVFDIEVLTPAFNQMGKYSHFLLCASFYPFDGEPYTLHLEFGDQCDDRRLLRDVINELDQYTFVVGHNIKGYDINWLKTRIMFYGWPDPPLRLFYYDTFSALKRVPLLHRKGLGNVIDFFRLKDVEKTKIMPIEWDMVRSPHRPDFEEAMERIIYHGLEDVKANKKLYDILMGLKYDPKPSWKLWPH